MPSIRGTGGNFCPACHHHKRGHGATFYIRIPEDSHEYICNKPTLKGCHNTIRDNMDQEGVFTKWEECRCMLEFYKS